MRSARPHFGDQPEPCRRRSATLAHRRRETSICAWDARGLLRRSPGRWWLLTAPVSPALQQLLQLLLDGRG